MKVYNSETNNIFFAGDIHGEFQTINVSINQYNLSDCAIVFCGDIGIGFEKEEYYIQTFNKLTKVLKKKNIHLYMFRGNHDSKDFFNGEHFNDFKYIHILPDYSVILCPTKAILCVGGATSIDRTYRLQCMERNAADYMRWHDCGWDEAYKNCKKFYWNNEAVVYDENELNQLDELGILIDTVCTHTAPSFCKPVTKIGIEGWLSLDENLSEDLDNERKSCELIYDYLKSHNHPLENWYYGHFHFHNTEIIDNVKFTLLDMSREKLDLI